MTSAHPRRVGPQGSADAPRGRHGLTACPGCVAGTPSPRHARLRAGPEWVPPQLPASPGRAGRVPPRRPGEGRGQGLSGWACPVQPHICPRCFRLVATGTAGLSPWHPQHPWQWLSLLGEWARLAARVEPRQVGRLLLTRIPREHRPRRARHPPPPETFSNMPSGLRVAVATTLSPSPTRPPAQQACCSLVSSSRQPSQTPFWCLLLFQTLLLSVTSANSQGHTLGSVPLSPPTGTPAARGGAVPLVSRV